ncbi:hypothetical protein ACWDTI_18925 [Gordonia sp. NPDC003424]
MIAPIEIKINLDDDVPHALGLLGCPQRPAERRDIWFAEARSTEEDTPLPLLSSHLIIKMRSGDQDDVTVRLRPCLPGRLVGRWQDPFTDGDFSYHLNGDWCGSHRAMAASAVSRREAGSVRAAMAEGTDPAHVLDSAQRQFLVTCTPPGVPIDHLMRLGPIDSSRWSGISLDGVDIAVERWKVPGDDLLEVSTVLRPRPGESVGALETRAVTKQFAMRRALIDRGLIPSATDVKTTRVLRALARSHA